MKSIILSTALAMTMMFGVAGVVGCSGGGGKTCKALAKKLCDGKDEAMCKKTAAWLDKQMTGPDGKKLSSSEANAGCKMILEDDRALNSYKKQVAKKVK